MHPSRTDPVGIAPARPQALRRKSRVDASTSSGSLAAPELQAERQAARENGGDRLREACSRLPETIWDCQRLRLDEAKVDKDHF